MSALDFAALFQRSPNPYMVLDPELRYVAANRAYLQATGRSLAELEGRSIFEMFPSDPDDPQGVANLEELRASFLRVLAERRVDTLALIRYAIPRKTAAGIVFDERYWSATHTPLFARDGRVAYILQHTVDVSELHRLKEALRAASPHPDNAEPDDAELEHVAGGVFSRAAAVQETNRRLNIERLHLRRLFEQAPGFMCVLRGPRQVYELANRAYDQLVGGRPIIGRTVAEALPELATQGFVELLDRVYSTGTPYVGRAVPVQLRAAPGEPLEQRFLDFVYQPVVEVDGSVSGIFVQGSDVTEQMQIRAELDRHREHLELLVRQRTEALEASEAERRETEATLRQAHKMEAVGKLTGGVAHDFNNVLQVIGGNLQLLQAAVGNDAAVVIRVRAALDAVDRGAKLASQLLSFARRQPLQPVVTNLERRLRAMDDLLRRAVGERIDIELRAGERLWNTSVDPNQLENAVLNLAINARDAMDGTGTLSFDLYNLAVTEDTSIESELVPGAYVVLSVSDTGCGMSPEIIERVFDPFFTTKPEGQGTGLGLSMVYGFVKQSGGHVRILSDPGVGTTLKLYLPASAAAEAMLESLLDVEPVGGDESVLVVEDDPAVRATVVDMLRGLGYRVREAVDGEHALEVIAEGEPIDVMFSDVMMPGAVRGIELADRARAARPDLGVLFTSGYTDDRILSDGKLDADVNLLSKPYRREDLARKLRHVLRERAQRLAALRALERLGTGQRATEQAATEHRASVQWTSERPMTEQRMTRNSVPPSNDTPRPLDVLFVEDEPDNRALTVQLLEMLGHRVVGVGDAQRALAELAERTFDVLLTDVTLPGMSGVELARAAIEHQPSLRVVFASGHDVEVLGGFPARMLQKPYAIEEIEQALYG